MKLSRYLMTLVTLFLFISTTGHAAHGHGGRFSQDGTRFDEELDERDFNALRDYVNTKRTINLAEKSCNLTISGDVRTEWRHLNEKGRRFCGKSNCKKCALNQCPQKNASLRGGNSRDYFGKPISRDDFDIEFNLRFDYVCDRNWAVVHLQFDNTAGVDGNGHPCKQDKCDPKCWKDKGGWHGSGTCDALCLKKAYWGYNLCCEGSTRLDVEIGRRNLYNIFDSKVQFLSRFDGIFVKYSTGCCCLADWYISAGGFVVNERIKHFAYVAETGLIDIGCSGFNLKYSFIHWNKYGKSYCQQRCKPRDPTCEEPYPEPRYGCCAIRNPKGFRFMISQITLDYEFEPEMFCCQPARFYGAFLINHNAHGKAKFKNKCCEWDSISRKEQNMGFYIGFTMGEVVEECDWAIDMRYEWVEAFAVPDNDVSGIGRGNVLDESVTSCAGRGNTNYKGYRLQALYALTDNLTIDTLIQWSRQINKKIGGRHRFGEVKVEAIYAF